MSSKLNCLGSTTEGPYTVYLCKKESKNSIVLLFQHAKRSPRHVLIVPADMTKEHVIEDTLFENTCRLCSTQCESEQSCGIALYEVKENNVYLAEFRIDKICGACTNELVTIKERLISGSFSEYMTASLL